MNHVLLLNASYQRLNFVSLQRAILLLLKEKAEPIEIDAAAALHSERHTFAVPLVIRLLTYVYVPYDRFAPPLSRRTIFSRDKHTCQFCGDTNGPLSIDHVLPRSRGGRTSWENCVTACLRCNHRKGNRTPEEAHMRLRTAPYRPTDPFIMLYDGSKHAPVWEKYA